MIQKRKVRVEGAGLPELVELINSSAVDGQVVEKVENDEHPHFWTATVTDRAEQPLRSTPILIHPIPVYSAQLTRPSHQAENELYNCYLDEAKESAIKTIQVITEHGTIEEMIHFSGQFSLWLQAMLANACALIKEPGRTEEARWRRGLLTRNFDLNMLDTKERKSCSKK